MSHGTHGLALAIAFAGSILAAATSAGTTNTGALVTLLALLSSLLLFLMLVRSVIGSIKPVQVLEHLLEPSEPSDLDE